MAYKQKGFMPITAKLQQTTKGGMVQEPLLNMGAPVKPSATPPVGKLTSSDNRAQSNKSRAAANKAKETAKAAAEKAFIEKKAKDLASKEFVTNSRGRKIKNPKYQGASKDAETKKSTYTSAKASEPGLDNIISKRNNATKGTAEYNRYQNQINKAYGTGPTNRSTTEKTASTITPKKTVSIETKGPKAEIKTIKTAPKAETTTGKEIKSAREAFRAGDITKKQKKAVIGEERAMRKDARANKKAERMAKNK